MKFNSAAFKRHTLNIRVFDSNRIKKSTCKHYPKQRWKGYINQSRL